MRSRRSGTAGRSVQSQSDHGHETGETSRGNGGNLVERVRPVRDASYRIVVAEPHDQWDWIEYWGQSGRLDEGYLIQYGTLTLPITAEWRVGRTVAC